MVFIILFGCYICVICPLLVSLCVCLSAFAHARSAAGLPVCAVCQSVSGLTDRSVSLCDWYEKREALSVLAPPPPPAPTLPATPTPPRSLSYRSNINVIFIDTVAAISVKFYVRAHHSVLLNLFLVHRSFKTLKMRVVFLSEVFFDQAQILPQC